MGMPIHISRGAIRRLQGQTGGMSVGDEGYPYCSDAWEHFGLLAADSRGPVSDGRVLPTCPVCAVLWDEAQLATHA